MPSVGVSVLCMVMDPACQSYGQSYSVSVYGVMTEVCVCGNKSISFDRAV
jgi:hypothetical protein